MESFRDYEKSDAVKNHYRKSRENQSTDHVLRMKSKYSKPSLKMSWSCIFYSLSSYIDVSDPDIDLPNVVHLYQTAEQLRKDGKPDWMQVVGFIHDIGKCIYLRGCNEDGTSVAEQWSIVGDTFVTGHPLPPSAVLQEYNSTSEQSIYEEGCGLRNCLVSYGHDEYLYNALKRYDLPEEALYIIRFHSLYPWHSGGDYKELEDDYDRFMKPYVQDFNKYDLYTKQNAVYTEEQLSEMWKYYSNLIYKFLPAEIEL